MNLYSASMCTFHPALIRSRWWVLAWFLMSLGVATAAPMVQPRLMDTVCSASGAPKVIIHTDDGAVEQTAADALHCPLCLVGGAPPNTVLALPPATPAAAAQPVSPPFARAPAATAAPPPARAPPFFLSQS
ncbi:DUF2946 family protein [Acidovorax sp.]|uniref:DUF2946 family protein n=1 Tax=Acidovorax sp. TaxID=1872122 RepID=UPI00338E74CB